jgi:hypothetical protein
MTARRGGRLAMAGGVLIAISGSHAAGIRTWSEDAAALARGLADGMAVSRDGWLYLAPRLSRIEAVEAPAAQIWSLVADPAGGGLFAGTGPEGRVLRLSPPGRAAEHATLGPPLVTALAALPDGRLLAGTAPDGLVYRIGASGAAEVFCETGERYVWALVVTDSGEIYAGTGERGRVLRILPSGGTEVLFDGDEAHVVSLLALPGGELLAGGAARGLVYRIDREGNALVLHDDDLAEVVALAVQEDGAVIAATIAAAEEETRRPAVHLRLPEGAPLSGAADESVGMIDETTVRGYIEGLAPREVLAPPRVRGRIVRIAADGSTRELWSSTQESPFCVAADAHGRVLFGTGEPARLHRIEPGGDVALLATLREAQVTALAEGSGSVYLATSNPAALYVVEERAAETASFVARPLDAGGPARWGSIRWQAEEAAGRTEFYTRTGNSEEPDATWSAWSPALTTAGGSPIVNPDGRYVQWRLRQSGGAGAGPRLAKVTLVYEPYNRPPELRDLRLDPAAPGTRAPLRLRWSARDADGDLPEITVRYRPVAGGAWSEAGVVGVEEPGATTESWRPFEWSWDTTEVPEGEYEVGIVATDQPANPAGEGLLAAEQPTVRAVVDRTPPTVEVTIEPDGAWTIHAEDTHSDLRRLDLVRHGRVRFTARPLDGVCDSRVERYRLTQPEPGDGWSVRGVDAAGNVAERAVPSE